IGHNPAFTNSASHTSTADVLSLSLSPYPRHLKVTGHIENFCLQQDDQFGISESWLKTNNLLSQVPLLGCTSQRNEGTGTRWRWCCSVY
ncbi:hypothetical protein J6590_105701, partial [Homalodisca vitripennis]